MKKFFNIFFLAISIIAFSGVFTSCDKDDDDEYYAGESEEDYRPNIYTIVSSWDLSKVTGLSTSEKKAIETELTSKVNASEKFDTRAQAVKEFDEVVDELRKIDCPAGMKGTLTLKRGTAIIKRANLQW